MKQFFILGRNPELSKTEVTEFLKSRDQQFTEILFKKNILILETNANINIQELGGTIQIGKIIFEGNPEQLQKHLDKNELIPADKFSYAIFGNQDPQILKDNFKKRKKKTTLKQGKKQIKFQNGKTQKLPKAEFYILYQDNFLGIANQIYNNTDDKKRDMQKPVRRESLAISPRLSKILINLSFPLFPTPRTPNTEHRRTNEICLLDPFCGIGSILQEALIKNINVFGIDKDKQATQDAEKNLKWLTKNYTIKNKYTIKNANAQKTPNLQFDAIATETPLGKTFRKKPTENEARQIILDFEAKIIPILKKLKQIKKPNAKIAITFPIVKNLHANIKKITEKTGLKIHTHPIQESRPDQFISRDILVFQ